MPNYLSYRYLIVLTVSLILSIPFLGRGLFETSEGRYAMVAKTMHQSGDFWIPKIDGKAHLTKPPLTYWVIALGQKIFGDNDFGSRILHTFCWLLQIMLMVRIGELLKDKTHGLIVGLIYATALFPSLGSWFLTTDPLLVFFQTMSLWSLLEFRRSKKNGWGYIFWVGLALAFNTKGPVALFPAIFWFIFFKKELRTLVNGLPIALFLLVASFWYLALEYQHQGILMRLLNDEILKRSTTDFSGRNPAWWSPLVTYFIPLFIGWGLWPLALEKNAFGQLRQSDLRFYITWILGTLIIFSFIQSRLILYILPLTIPATLLLAESIKLSPRFVNVLALNFILVFIIKSFVTLSPYDSNAEQIAHFAKENAGEHKVYFLNEYLYGVEFYLGPQFSRFPNYKSVVEAIKRQDLVETVIYQDKRKHIVDEMVDASARQIIEHKKLGKWNFVRFRSKDKASTVAN